MATLGGIVFTGILVVAAVGDLRTRRIPNRLVAVLAVLGMIFSIAQEPSVWGLIRGSEGLIVGLACWLPFYALGWLGAGDVKLFGAAGAWLGPLQALEGALIGALAGAVLSLIWMLKSRGVRDTAVTLGMAASSPGLLAPSTQEPARRSTMPYGIALAFGAICGGWLPGLLFR
ncbi:MAG: prepilin peptidase [Gemmatimonadales bacterium]